MRKTNLSEPNSSFSFYNLSDCHSGIVCANIFNGFAHSNYKHQMMQNNFMCKYCGCQYTAYCTMQCVCEDSTSHTISIYKRNRYVIYLYVCMNRIRTAYTIINKRISAPSKSPFLHCLQLKRNTPFYWVKIQHVSTLTWISLLDCVVY